MNKDEKELLELVEKVASKTFGCDIEPVKYEDMLNKLADILSKCLKRKVKVSVDGNDMIVKVKKHMKNVIMEKPYQLHTYGWTTVTMKDLRKGAYYKGIFYGCHMHTHDVGNVYRDIETWRYPNEQIEKKIEDDKRYKVWADYRDAADPMDSSCTYTVIYIEEV